MNSDYIHIAMWILLNYTDANNNWGLIDTQEILNRNLEMQGIYKLDWNDAIAME